MTINESNDVTCKTKKNSSYQMSYEFELIHKTIKHIKYSQNSKILKLETKRLKKKQQRNAYNEAKIFFK